MQTNKDTRKEDLLKELASDYANYLVVDSNDEVRVNITFWKQLEFLNDVDIVLPVSSVVEIANSYSKPVIECRGILVSAGECKFTISKHLKINQFHFYVLDLNRST